jgi:delta1-piperideine-2-carboxylate reductase
VSDTINLSLTKVHELAVRALKRHGANDEHAQAIARIIVAGERDECFSHGVYRLIITCHSLKNGGVDGQAIPAISDRATSVVALDAKFGFSQLAFEMGIPLLVKKARKHGLAAMVINNCYHFAALWPDVEAIALHGVAALAFNPSHAGVAPAGGYKPVFGTNPIAFAWPRPDQNPYVFDFATSMVARGEIELHRRTGRDIPKGWGVDAQGQSTTDPAQVLDGGAMLTFGGHKGSALSTMIELMAGPLIGDLTSMDSLHLDAGRAASPCHGALVLAFDLSVLGAGDPVAQQHRAEALFAAITVQGARLPSQRRFEARARSTVYGVHIPKKLFDEVSALAH